MNRLTVAAAMLSLLSAAGCNGGKLALSLRTQGDEVIVEVADTGAGIPEVDQEKVFEFAFTTREGGHGLGLAMVHQCIVEEHGGKISVASTLRKGTTFTIWIPAGTGMPVGRAPGTGAG